MQMQRVKLYMSSTAIEASRQLWLSLSTDPLWLLTMSTRELGVALSVNRPSCLSIDMCSGRFPSQILSSFHIWIQSFWFSFLPGLSDYIKRCIVPIDCSLNWLIWIKSLSLLPRGCRQLSNLTKFVFSRFLSRLFVLAIFWLFYSKTLVFTLNLRQYSHQCLTNLCLKFYPQ